MRQKQDIPATDYGLYASIGRDGVERESAYAGEINYFKQGAYNQTNGKIRRNMVWIQDLKLITEILQSNMKMEVMLKFGLKKPL